MAKKHFLLQWRTKKQFRTGDAAMIKFLGTWDGRLMFKTRDEALLFGRRENAAARKLKICLHDEYRVIDVRVKVSQQKDRQCNIR